MCNPGGNGCNNILCRRFEVPAKELVREFFRSDGRVVLVPAEADTVGRWFLKTILFVAHPEARHSVVEYGLPSWKCPPPCLYRWMTNGQEPPSDLSLLVSRRREPSPNDPSPRYIELPTLVAAGVERICEVQVVGFRGLELTLVYHPGWRIEHPQVAEGKAIRLWPPDPSVSVDLAALEPVSPRDTRFVDGPILELTPGALEGDLPLLSTGLDMFELMRSPLVFMAAAPRLAS
jgi:hypothetical protein